MKHRGGVGCRVDMIKQIVTNVSVGLGIGMNLTDYFVA